MNGTQTFRTGPDPRYRGLVYDLGMHNGDDTAHYLEQGYRVLAVEADPDLVASAEKRFGSAIQAGQLCILNVGISESRGTATFWICDDNTIWNSFLEELAGRKGCRHHAIEVPVRTLPDILDEYGTPQYLKIDIEGYDEICIRSLVGRSLPKYISAEDNAHITDSGTPTLIAALQEVGYKRFKLISQHDHRALMGRTGSSAMERICDLLRIPKHRPENAFPEGSSGPWGEESDGPWLTFKDAARVYIESKELYEHDPRRRDFWVDWHAAR